MNSRGKQTRSIGKAARCAGLLALAALAAPLAAQAQTATIFATLGNFDVVNNTGQDAHGFEIDFDGMQPADFVYMYRYNRYGAPVVSASATGTILRWSDLAQTTVAHAPNTPVQSCYQNVGGGPTGVSTPGYATAGCEHFGVVAQFSLHLAATAKMSWLVDDPANAGSLVPLDPPVAVAAPTYYITPPAVPANPPALVVVVEAPEPAPAEAPELYGDAQWMKTFITQLPREVSLDELMTDNPIVPQAAAQIEVNWEVVQAEPANIHTQRSSKLHQSNLDPTTRSVVRRFELYDYTGTYDAVTNQALCADVTCTAPGAGELGDFISAQMTAANVQTDSVTVTKAGTGGGNVDSADKLIACGNKCVVPYNAGTAVALTAKANSGSVFAGWTGACAGTAATCNVSANGHVDVGATFNTAPTGGGGGGGGGTTTATFTLSVGRSNTGTVTATPNGVDRALSCGSACSAKFNSGTAVTLTATPPAGKQFGSWSGACSGTATTCSVTMSKDTSVQANFSK